MTTAELVARTCASSGVPVVPEDGAALARVAALLTKQPAEDRRRHVSNDGRQLDEAA